MPCSPTRSVSSAFEHIAPGRYLLRAVIDANTNRAFDRRELFDSATITVGDSIAREMLAFVHDSIGTGIAEVTLADSLALRVTFDRPLQPGVPVTLAQFSLRAADSSVVPIAAVSVGSVYERERADSARAKAVRDSVRQAQVADSIRRANPQAAPPPRPTPPVAAPAPRASPARSTNRHIAPAAAQRAYSRDVRDAEARPAVGTSSVVSIARRFAAQSDGHSALVRSRVHHASGAPSG